MSRNTEHPRFDISFQEGILHLALTDQVFGKKFVLYLEDDRNKKRPDIFSSEYHQMLYNCLSTSIKKFGVIPSKGQIVTQMQEKHEGGVVDVVAKIYDKVVSIQLQDQEFYRKHLTDFYKAVKTANAFVSIKQSAEEKGILSAADVMRKAVVEIDEIDLEKDSLQRLSMVIHEDFEDKTEDEEKPAKYISTGVPDLDKHMIGGGLPTGGLLTILGSNNVGKTTVTISLAANAIKTGHKVVHVALDGRENEARTKYVANLCGIPVKNIYLKQLSPSEKEVIRQTVARLDDRLLILNVTDYSNKVEKLIARLESLRESFGYDVCVVDYIGVLGTIERVSSLREVNVVTHRMFRTFARKLNVLVMSPAQATRDAQKKNYGTESLTDRTGKYILRSTDIAEADDIGRVSEAILTVNRTDEEKNAGMMRLFLEKQRMGETGKLAGLYTDFSCSTINTGRFFDPDVIVEAAELFDEKSDPDTARTKILQEKDRERMRKKAGKLLGEIYTLNQKTKDLADKITVEPDIINRERLSEYLESTKRTCDETKSQLRSSAALLYPGATKEMLSQMEDQLREMKKEGSAANKVDISKTELEVKILKSLFS